MSMLIFGTGVVCKAFMRSYNIAADDVEGFVESNAQDELFEGRPLYSVDKLGGVQYYEIYVASAWYNMVEELFEQGIPKSKIVLCHIKLVMEYLDRNGKLDVKVKLTSILTNKLFLENIIDEEPKRIGDNEMIVVRDYCRTGTLQLLAKEINDGNVKGDVAELGVYQGDFSKYINELYPNRKLYLYDTFNGFDEKQQQSNINNSFSTEKDIINSDFSDTSVQIVIDKLPYPNLAIVRKGTFPDTIVDDVEYAFVSIDCDLYEPIYAGLEYFYPRLADGGYIMIHDYNLEKFMRGVHKAVDDYENKIERKLCKVPIPDECGSLVICK